MNLLFVSHSFGQGGAQRSLFELVSYCKQKGDSCLVIGPRTGPKIDEYIDVGISVVPIRLGSMFSGNGWFWRTRKVAKLLLNVYQIVKQIRRFHPHIVYTNTSSVLAGALAAKLTAKPHIWHIRENFTTFPAKYIFPFSTVSRIIARFSERVIFVSALTMKSLYPDGYSKTVVVHNGVDSSRFRDRCSEASRPDKNDSSLELTTVGFLGTLSHRRGLDVLLKAFAIVKPEHPRLLLHIWGDGHDDYAQVVRELAKSLGISESMKLNGYVDDVPKILPMHDVVVVPSRSESFSRITLETMAAGVPVIATRCGGPEEFVEDGITGRLVPPDDPEELAKALNWILENPERALEMARKAQQKTRTHFRLEDKLHDIREIVKCMAQKQQNSQHL